MRRTTGPPLSRGLSRHFPRYSSLGISTFVNPSDCASAGHRPAVSTIFDTKALRVGASIAANAPEAANTSKADRTSCLQESSLALIARAASLPRGSRSEPCGAFTYVTPFVPIVIHGLPPRAARFSAGALMTTVPSARSSISDSSKSRNLYHWTPTGSPTGPSKITTRCRPLAPTGVHHRPQLMYTSDAKRSRSLEGRGLMPSRAKAYYFSLTDSL